MSSSVRDVVSEVNDLAGLRMFVFVESPKTGAGHQAAAAAIQRGMVPVVLVKEPEHLERFVWTVYRDMGAHIVRCDTSTLGTVVDVCRELARVGELVGVTCVYEYFTERTAAVARALGLPGPAPDAVAACRSKGSLRSALSVHPGLNPDHAIVASPEEAVVAAQAIGLPVVVKPTCLTGSVYVKRCDTVDQVWDMATKVIGMGRYLSVDVEPLAVIEELLTGPEFSVEIVDGKVAGVTAKDVACPPYFIEMGHVFPAPIDPGLEELVVGSALDGLRATGLTVGAAHVEVKLTAPGSGVGRVVEVNPRLGGDRIPELVRLATGVDLAAAQIDGLLGRPVDLRRRSSLVAAVRFALTPAKGRFLGVDGVDDARAVDGVTEVQMKRDVGDVYYAHGSNRDRVAHVIAIGATAEEAVARADEGLARLRFRWEDVSGSPEYP